jgi:hypothetical protein
MKSSFSWGPIIGYWGLFYTIMEAITMFFCDIFLPIENIDIAQSFDKTYYEEEPLTYGDHMFNVSSLDEKKSEEPVDKLLDMYSRELNLNPEVKSFDTKSRYRVIKPKLI